MSLAYAILSILNVAPMTGYDLKHEAFDATVQHFWPADQSQIYRTLARLAEQGHVTMTVEPQDERPDRKVYSITPEGQAALGEWLREPQTPPTLRDPFLVQTYFGMEVPNDELRALVEARLTHHHARLAELRSIPIPSTSDRPRDRWLALQHLTLDYGLALEETNIAWLERCLAVLDALPEPDEVEDFRTRFSSPTEG